LQVACVGEFVEVDDGLTRGGKPVQYKVAANKASAASHKYHESKLLL